MLECSFYKDGDFNPRSRVGNDTPVMLLYFFPFISIHVPAWGTTIWCEYLQGNQEFQSTFPRGERLREHIADAMKQISIHVPAWGTTFRSHLLNTALTFQSTFPRGERRTLNLHMCSGQDFNPRSRVGNDNCYVFCKNS